MASGNGSHTHDGFKRLPNDNGSKDYPTIRTAKSSEAIGKILSGSRRCRFEYPIH